MPVPCLRLANSARRMGGTRGRATRRGEGRAPGAGAGEAEQTACNGRLLGRRKSPVARGHGTPPRGVEGPPRPDAAPGCGMKGRGRQGRARGRPGSPLAEHPLALVLLAIGVDQGALAMHLAILQRARSERAEPEPRAACTGRGPAARFPGSGGSRRGRARETGRSERHRDRARAPPRPQLDGCARPRVAERARLTWICPVYCIFARTGPRAASAVLGGLPLQMALAPRVVLVFGFASDLAARRQSPGAAGSWPAVEPLPRRTLLARLQAGPLSRPLALLWRCAALPPPCSGRRSSAACAVRLSAMSAAARQRPRPGPGPPARPGAPRARAGPFARATRRLERPAAGTRRPWRGRPGC